MRLKRDDETLAYCRIFGSKSGALHLHYSFSDGARTKPHEDVPIDPATMNMERFDSLEDHEWLVHCKAIRFGVTKGGLFVAMNATSVTLALLDDRNDFQALAAFNQRAMKTMTIDINRLPEPGRGLPHR